MLTTLTDKSRKLGRADEPNQLDPEREALADPLVLCFLRAAQRGRELRKARADRQSTKSKRALTKVAAQSRKRPTGQ